MAGEDFIVHMYHVFFTHSSVSLDARLDESQAGIKVAGRNINNLRYAGNTTLMAESKGASWWRWKKESKKAGLKLNIKKN